MHKELWHPHIERWGTPTKERWGTPTKERWGTPSKERLSTPSKNQSRNISTTCAIMTRRNMLRG